MKRRQKKFNRNRPGFFARSTFLLVAAIIIAGGLYFLFPRDRHKGNAANPHPNRPVASGAICPSGEFAFTQEELTARKKAAIAGDPKAVHQVINYYGFYKNDREEERRWLAVGALLREESAIHNLKTMNTSIAQALRLSPQQEETLRRADFQTDPSAAFFLYAGYSLKSDIAAADTMLRLIQDRKIEIPALLLMGIAQINDNAIRDR